MSTDSFSHPASTCRTDVKYLELNWRHSPLCSRCANGYHANSRQPNGRHANGHHANSRQANGRHANGRHANSPVRSHWGPARTVMNEDIMINPTETACCQCSYSFCKNKNIFISIIIIVGVSMIVSRSLVCQAAFRTWRTNRMQRWAGLVEISRKLRSCSRSLLLFYFYWKLLIYKLYGNDQIELQVT